MRKLLFLFFLIAIMLVAAPVYAQATAPAGEAPINWAAPIAAGIGMAIASGLCGLGQGKATAAASEAIARNPSATAGIRFALILGLVLIESLGLVAFSWVVGLGGRRPSLGLVAVADVVSAGLCAQRAVKQRETAGAGRSPPLEGRLGAVEQVAEAGFGCWNSARHQQFACRPARQRNA